MKKGAVEKRTSLSIFVCCTADSHTDTGLHQLHNNGSLVLFSIAWKGHMSTGHKVPPLTEYFHNKQLILYKV